MSDSLHNESFFESDLFNEPIRDSFRNLRIKRELSSSMTKKKSHIKMIISKFKTRKNIFLRETYFFIIIIIINANYI